MSVENSMLLKQEVSLLNMSNNEMSHYTDQRSLQMQAVLFCNLIHIDTITPSFIKM